MKVGTLALALTAAALAGCAAPVKPLYHWDNYQRLVYESFKSDGASPNEQLDSLRAQAEKAKAAGLALPPGFRAHMGIVLLRLGQDADARAQFEAEKKTFPESGQYMDFVLKSMQPNKS